MLTRGHSEDGRNAVIPSGPCIYVSAETPTLDIVHSCTFLVGDPERIKASVNSPEQFPNSKICAHQDCPLKAVSIITSHEPPSQEWENDQLLDMLDLRKRYADAFVEGESDDISRLM